ncbi:acyl-CoA thioesterase [Aneurinibacillus sp. Ricciae_BoGa-3]|uniref:acyl-CoA thioesterase n=1 Tax=Aneurinibacillus sp. Ricciae_BoGa-3 TaxID=3022697 RepID=UPI0023406F39|nr:acyl-CoA thioesterase [Aneurinibacillus sp. Ricciae_BoGa-3]WCK55468.1 acyl-CoA thioesterase [Aneurinibacillus sp. Ricciae_BoGa-3]
MTEKFCRESRTIKSSLVLPPDTNYHGTLFGGKLMSYIDDIASISAMRHARCAVVTASTDSVDFLYPIETRDAVSLESYVSWTGKSSMEVFVKVITEELMSGKRKIAATSFLTFVALDNNKKPVTVPKVIPETKEEMKLHEMGARRAEMRKMRREDSKELAEFLTTNSPWE